MDKRGGFGEFWDDVANTQSVDCFPREYDDFFDPDNEW